MPGSGFSPGDSRSNNVLNSLRSFLFLTTVYKSLVLLALTVEGIFHVNKFTYWNFTIQWLFDLALLAATYVQGPALAVLNLYVFPLVYGDMFLVFALIRVIIWLNDWPFVQSSIFGLGDYTIGTIYLADFVIHTMPMFLRLLVLSAGHLAVLRDVVQGVLKDRSAPVLSVISGQHCSPARKFFTLATWWLFSPLITICIYATLFNPLEEYPIGLTLFQGVLTVFALNAVSQFFLFWWVTARTDICLRIGCETRCVCVGTYLLHPPLPPPSCNHHHHHHHHCQQSCCSEIAEQRKAGRINVMPVTVPVTVPVKCVRV